MNDLVPSMGSMIHLKCGSPFASPDSSPRIECPGNARETIDRITCSASRSAQVTGVLSDLVSTATPELKYARVRFPPRYAASVATSSSSLNEGMRVFSRCGPHDTTRTSCNNRRARRDLPLHLTRSTNLEEIVI